MATVLVSIMVSIWTVVVITILIQLFLAVLTAQDAHSRGHDRAEWFILVLIFGILGIIVYLITRNDRRLPESEWPPKREWKPIRVFLQYSASSMVGVFILGGVGLTIITDMYLDGIVSILGLAIILYVLTRNHSRLPESERLSNQEWKSIQGYLQYSLLGIVGIVIFGGVGLLLAREMLLLPKRALLGLVIAPVSLFAWKRFS